jgi:hypothetical protein
MTKRMKRLSVAAAVGLLILAGAFWWHCRRARAFQFLGDERPVHHTAYPTGSMDIYCFSGEFESVCARASRDLRRAGFADVTIPDLGDAHREFRRPGLNQITVHVQRGQFEKEMAYVRYYSISRRWVSVEVDRTRRSLREYLAELLRRQPPPSPPPPARLKTTPGDGWQVEH